MLQPRNSLVAVQLHKKAEERVGQIILPSGKGHEFMEATVLKVGPGRPLENGGFGGTGDLKEGDRVVVKTGQYMPQGHRAQNHIEFGVGDEKVSLVNEQDIVAVVPADASLKLV